MKRGEVEEQPVAFRFCYIFILILLLWILLDFLQVHDLASGINLIPDEVWHFLHLMMWLWAVRNLFDDDAGGIRWLCRVCLAVTLWLSSTVLMVIIVLSVHVKIGGSL